MFSPDAILIVVARVMTIGMLANRCLLIADAVSNGLSRARSIVRPIFARTVAQNLGCKKINLRGLGSSAADA